MSQMEQKAFEAGTHIHYDLLEAAGLKLKGGICKIRGEYHLFIDRRTSVSERIEIINEYLEHPLPEDVPSHG